MEKRRVLKEMSVDVADVAVCFSVQVPLFSFCFMPKSQSLTTRALTQSGAKALAQSPRAVSGCPSTCSDTLRPLSTASRPPPGLGRSEIHIALMQS